MSFRYSQSEIFCPHTDSYFRIAHTSPVDLSLQRWRQNYMEVVHLSPRSSKLMHSSRFS